MMPELSVTEYAKHRDVSRASVYNALNDGRLPAAVKRGKKIDVEAADAAWAASTNTSSPRNSVTGSPKMGVSPKGEKPEAGDDRPKSDTATLNSIKVRTETAKAERAEMELARMRDELVEAQAIRKSAFHSARVTRDLLMGIPARLSTELAGMTDDTEVYARLEEALREVCAVIDEAVRKPDWAPKKGQP